MPTEGRITLVAADLHESGILEGLATKLGEAGFTTFSMLGYGRDSPLIPAEIEEAVGVSDLLICAASDNSAGEVAACLHAVACSPPKPIVLLALGPWSWRKEEFKQIRQHVHVLFVNDDEERWQAEVLYPNTTVVITTGNPAWEDFFFPSRSREEVQGILGITPHEKLILVAGEKEVHLNIPLVVCLLEALRFLPDLESFRVIFAIHPGHRPLPRQESLTDLVRFYDEQFRSSHPGMRVQISCKSDPFGIGTPDMLPGADLVVGINSNVQIQAACLRIPTIAVLLSGAFRGIESPWESKGWWPPCDKGAVAGLYDLSPTRLALYILELHQSLITPAAMRMHEAQERAYPKPTERGRAHRLMVETIKTL